MFTYAGIGLDSFARIEGDCSVRYEVVGGEAQFEFGTAACALNLVCSERGLYLLLRTVSDARDELRSA